MLGVRFSLFSKIMLWFFLNLVILGVLFLLIFGLNVQFGRGSRFFGGTSNRIEAISRLIESDIDEKSREDRDDILDRYTGAYNVNFYLFDSNGIQLGGQSVTLPDDVFADITRDEGFGPPPGGATGAPHRVPGDLPPPGPPATVSFRSSNPTFYWLVIRTMTFNEGSAEPIRTRIIVRSDSFYGYGLFFDPRPWMAVGAIIVVVSILFWLHFVRNITRSVGQMTGAAKQIAGEDFSVRVDARRTDELGDLGSSINDLASRLSGFVNGQKRFLGDISHELNSPLARMQFALSILEEHARSEDKMHIDDVREEVELMSKLVGELLSYSKTGIQGAAIRLEPVNLRDIVNEVVTRERPAGKTDIKVEISDQVEAEGQPELLFRALSNVIRNSVAYTNGNGKIIVSAQDEGKDVTLTVSDEGPGVPDDMLEKIFDPLFRVADDRSRATGGTGLGLAIVKTCIEACGGGVEARNRAPHGLDVVIRLNKTLV